MLAPQRVPGTEDMAEEAPDTEGESEALRDYYAFFASNYIFDVLLTAILAGLSIGLLGGAGAFLETAFCGFLHTPAFLTPLLIAMDMMFAADGAVCLRLAVAIFQKDEAAGLTLVNVATASGSFVVWVVYKGLYLWSYPPAGLHGLASVILTVVVAAVKLNKIRITLEFMDNVRAGRVVTKPLAQRRSRDERIQQTKGANVCWTVVIVELVLISLVVIGAAVVHLCVGDREAAPPGPSSGAAAARRLHA
jgi:hypothetical protein